MGRRCGDIPQAALLSPAERKHAMDPAKLRKDFPVLRSASPPIYFDNACVTMKPDQVIAAEREYEEKFPGCTRSLHSLGREATEREEAARKTLAAFLGAKPECTVFTRNTTEAINLVANTFPFQRGDVLLGTDKEHNSNLVPWLRAAERNGLERRVVSTQGDVLKNFEQAFAKAKKEGKRVALAAVVHTSNLDGTTHPAKELAALAHKHGAALLLDAAQSAPHKPVSLKSLGADFIACSGHKMLGPSGTGLLAMAPEWAEKLPPFLVGGETVERTTYTSATFQGSPHKFEAGLQNYSGILGLAEAARYLQRVGLEDMEKHETALNKLATKGLLEIPGARIVGPEDPKKRSGILSFTLPGLDFHETALLLDNTRHIMVRSGQHCVHSWFHANNMEGCARASFYLYNTKEEVALFLDALHGIAKLGKK